MFLFVFADARLSCDSFVVALCAEKGIKQTHFAAGFFFGFCRNQNLLVFAFFS